jgi:hypothetical protein
VRINLEIMNVTVGNRAGGGRHTEGRRPLYRAGRRYREREGRRRERMRIGRWNFDMKRNNNNNNNNEILGLAEVRNNRPRGIVTHTNKDGTDTKFRNVGF